MNNNKELITIASTFLVIVMIAMYMFVSQPKNNNMSVETRELKILIEQHDSELDSVNNKLNNIHTRLDETDEKFHKTGN
jgi:peptidoglycan hydrolase CwlO-like protein